jgi:hypothetical protein
MKPRRYIPLALSSLLVAIAALVFFLTGCEGDNFLSQEGLETPGRLPLLRTSTAPPMDDPRDKIWDRAYAGLIDVSDVDPAGSLVAQTIQLKGIISQGRLYLRAQWEDGSYSAHPNPLVHLIEVDSGIPPDPPDTNDFWKRIPSSESDQDRFSVIWDVGNNGTEGSDCYSMCHADDDRSPAGDRMYTTGGGNVDVWHWMAANADPVLLAQDEYWSANGRDLDAPGEAIAQSNFDQADEQPFVTHEDQTAFFGNFLKSTDTVSYETAISWPDSFSVPGYWLDVNSSGSVTDIASYSSYNTSTGEWLVLLSRALNTGHTDDIDLTQVPSGDSILITVAVMNNSGEKHVGSGPFFVIFP